MVFCDWKTQKYNFHRAEKVSLQILSKFGATQSDSATWPDNFFPPILSVSSSWDKTIVNIAQLVAYQLGTGEVPGSNLVKGKNFSMKISNWINPAVVA